MRHLLGTVLAALVLAGCASATESPVATDDPTATPTPTTSTAPDAERNDLPSSPPPIRVVVDGTEVEAGRVSYCWTGGNGSGACVDMVGNALEDLPSVTGDSVGFRFALPLARFTASLTPVGGKGAAGSVDAVELGRGEYRLDAGSLAPGRYRVTMIARLPQGEAPGEFVWTIPG